jgi:hypothetical protein
MILNKIYYLNIAWMQEFKQFESGWPPRILGRAWRLEYSGIGYFSKFRVFGMKMVLRKCKEFTSKSLRTDSPSFVIPRPS